MFKHGNRQKNIILVSPEQDSVFGPSGRLIPYEKLTEPVKVETGTASYGGVWWQLFAVLLLVGGFVSVALTGVDDVLVFNGSDMNAVVKPVVVFALPDEEYGRAPLNYGAQVTFTQPDFFSQVRDSFIADERYFIEVDLTEMQIIYREDGEVRFSATILAKGREGSWWQTPAGVYDISYKSPSHYSSFGGVTMPWSMAFQGNFFIHGWPIRPDGTPVSGEYSGGCVRLSDEDAKTLYEMVRLGTPVLVHEVGFENDGFLYEPKAVSVSAEQYLLADIKSSTVLASSDLATVAPIASITKLMTALVAAEHINLDRNVSIGQLQHATSMVPRLSERHSVSMYSLLQLLLVESSNEASEVIASQLGRARFIELMNNKASSLGLYQTVFTDPSGLDSGNQSTLADLLRLLQYLYHNRKFVLDLTRDQDLPTAYVSGQFGRLNNFNLIADLEDFVGGKVGETLAAGQTSASLHSVSVRGEERVVAVVVLGSEDREGDVKALLKHFADWYGR